MADIGFSDKELQAILAGKSTNCTFLASQRARLLLSFGHGDSCSEGPSSSAALYYALKGMPPRQIRPGSAQRVPCQPSQARALGKPNKKRQPSPSSANEAPELLIKPSHLAHGSLAHGAAALSARSPTTQVCTQIPQ